MSYFTFWYTDRYAEKLLSAGDPPSEYEARKKYDAEMDQLVMEAAWRAIRQHRRENTYWYRIFKRVKRLLWPS